MIDIAVIGLGDLGRIESDICANHPDVQLVAGVDPNADARYEYQTTFDVPVYEEYDEMLTAHDTLLDAAIVATPHTLHYEQALACLERDLDVFIEKPMVTDIAEAVALVDCADEHERILQVGYQRHFHPAYQHIKQLIDDGALGRIHTINCFLGQDWIRNNTDSWRSTPSLSGGGQLYDSGSHLLDVLLWTTDTEPKTVASTIECRDHEVDINTAVAATLSRNGHPITASIGITADGTSTSGTEEGLYVWGTEGRLAYGKDGLHLYGKGEGDRDTLRQIEIGPSPDFHELVERKVTNFLGAVRNEHDAAVPGSFGLAVTAMTEAIYQSHETGQRVDVDFADRTAV